jgi:hypothetical protein
MDPARPPAMIMPQPLTAAPGREERLAGARKPGAQEPGLSRIRMARLLPAHNAFRPPFARVCHV